MVVGVRCFVFLSSIKVMGEVGYFMEMIFCYLEDVYGCLKCEVEEVLLRFFVEVGFEVVILRLLLIYGFGVKGNFFSLMWVVKKGLLFFFGVVWNVCSLFYFGNFVDVIVLCVNYLVVVGCVFLLCDGVKVLMLEFICGVVEVVGCKVMLLFVLILLMLVVVGLFGKCVVVGWFFGDLSVDSLLLFCEFGWKLLFGMCEGFEVIVWWYEVGMFCL